MSTAKEILQQYWSYPSFKPLQEEIIAAVLEKRDTLALLPTGGGKSICYQVPGMLNDGLCLVVSPLIALMKDQQNDLEARGIKATILYSGMSYREIDVALDNAIYGPYKFLFVSPERLETELFQARLPQMNLNLLAVDEAHCISQWGYDFRPSYLKIAQVREICPAVPILAITASATPVVQKDIVEKLLFNKKNSRLFIKSFERPNIIYAAIEEENKDQRMLDLVSKIKGSALIYGRTRRTVKEIATTLQRENISADFYHGGMDNAERSRKQEAWKNNRCRIMACTNAFGMGIDKPDVRLIVHYDMPDSPEAYYQEAGRAGRDGKKAFAIVLYNDHDKLKIQKQREDSFPSHAELLCIYHALGNYFNLPEGSGKGESFDFILTDFCEKYNLNPLKTLSGLKLLEEAVYIQLSEALFMPSRIMCIAAPEDVYRFQLENPPYEKLFQFVLRAYGGSFEEYVTINEWQISKKIQMRPREVFKKLHYLHQIGLIDYQPQKNAPQLTFLTGRYAKSSLHIDMKMVKERQQAGAQRLRAMMTYINVQEQCRVKILLSYFGEKAESDCGHCDWCLKHKKRELTLTELQRELLKILADSSLKMKAIEQRVGISDNVLLIEAIRILIDKKKLVCIEGNFSLL